MHSKRPTITFWLLGVILLGVVAGTAVALRLWYSPVQSSSQTPGSRKPYVPEYRFNVLSGAPNAASRPTSFKFSVLDSSGQPYRRYRVDNTKLMHLIVVRKDRSNFQHLHPTYDAASGNFTIDSLAIPTDGSYRFFANFLPADARTDEMNMKQTVAPYTDISVGSGQYTPQPVAAQKFSNSVGGFDTEFFFPPSDDSAGPPNTSFFAKQENSINISINKAGQPYKQLQPYLGNLGHLVILGPDLEFIHAHPQSELSAEQTGLLSFAATLPVKGAYKLYLQTQADNTVSTFDYSLTATQ